MEDIILACQYCKAKFRFPHKEIKIKFQCKTCKATYFALDGQITDSIAPEGYEVPPEEPIQEKSIGPEPTEEEETIPSPIGVQNEGVSEPPISLKINYWQWAAIFLAGLLAVESYLMLVHDPHSAEDQLTTKLMDALKKPPGKDYATAESFMSTATRKDFNILMTSQLMGDSASKADAMQFVNSLQPLEYLTSRRFKYATVTGDTSYFILNYVKDGPFLQVHADISQFIGN